jgi:hypothetical protein
MLCFAPQLHSATHLWPGAKYNIILKEAMFYQFKRAQRTGEGSLHPPPEGRGIRDPSRSRCNKPIKIDKTKPLTEISLRK